MLRATLDGDIKTMNEILELAQKALLQDGSIIEIEDGLKELCVLRSSFF